MHFINVGFYRTVEGNFLSQNPLTNRRKFYPQQTQTFFIFSTLWWFYGRCVLQVFEHDISMLFWGGYNPRWEVTIRLRNFGHSEWHVTMNEGWQYILFYFFGFWFGKFKVDIYTDLEVGESYLDLKLMEPIANLDTNSHQDKTKIEFCASDKIWSGSCL